MTRTDADLRSRTRGSAAWATVGSTVNQVLQLALFVALARLLSPVDFGTVALATLVLDFMLALSAAGVPAAVIRKPELAAVEADTAFWTNLGLGLAAFVLVLALAPLAAVVFHRAELTPILWALSANLLIAPLGAIHVARIQRELGFRALALRTVLANLSGGVVGLVLAFHGAGAWALVARGLIASLATLVVAWVALPWKPALRYDRAAGAHLLHFGSRLMGAQLLGQLDARGLELAAGLLINPATVGVLRVAGRCFSLLSQLTLGPLRQIALPVLAQAKGDLAQTRTAYAELTRMAGLLVFPVFLGAVAISDLAFPLVFGPRWALSAIVGPALCVMIVPLVFNLLLNAALAAGGHAGTALKWGLLQTLLGLPLAFLSAPFGLIALLAVTIARSYLVIPVGAILLRRYAGLTLTEILRPLLEPLVAAGTMSVAVLGLKTLLTPLLPPLSRLAVLIGAGVVAYLVILAVIAPNLRRDLAALLRRRRDGAVMAAAQASLED